ncbi:MAG: putative glycoside hydrolase [Firmicutes bacterium]|nr:putative glycoside hydrolase [Bacillota bacterium]
MYRPARIHLICGGLILILLLSGIKPVKSEEPLESDNLAKAKAAFEIGPRQQELKISEEKAGLDRFPDSVKDLGQLLNSLGEEPPIVKGVYATAWMTGKAGFLEKMFDFSAKTEVNTMVIDVKDDSGRISYPSKTPLAQAVGAGSSKFDPEKVIRLLNRHQIYPIARIVVFKDPHLAGRRPDLAVKSSEGGIWRDFKGLAWVDPYSRTVWEYNVAVAKEAAGFGFKEIQFDYVRFTSDGPLQTCRYSFSDGKSKADTISAFLEYAYRELKPLGVKVSADVFGATCTSDGDMGIGQVFEKIAAHVDIICPMVYPSHYRRGDLNIPDPDRDPYQTVYRSMMDAKRKAAALKKPVIIRPWLQDFSLRNRYGREQLLAQIKAVQDAGLQEWIFWNPSNNYDINKYPLKTEPAMLPALPPALLDPAPRLILPLRDGRLAF